MKSEKQIRDRIAEIDFELAHNVVLTNDTILRLVFEKRALLWVLEDE